MESDLSDQFSDKAELNFDEEDNDAYQDDENDDGDYIEETHKYTAKTKRKIPPPVSNRPHRRMKPQKLKEWSDEEYESEEVVTSTKRTALTTTTIELDQDEAFDEDSENDDLYDKVIEPEVSRVDDDDDEDDEGEDQNGDLEEDVTTMTEPDTERDATDLGSAGSSISNLRQSGGSKMLQNLLSDGSSRKKLTEEEIQLKRAENARKRKNLSEKRSEEEKREVINKLLKRRAAKVRATPSKDDEKDTDDNGFNRPRRPYITYGMTRTILGRDKDVYCTF